MVRVGIIGCGNIARSAHIPAYMARHDVTCSHFCDIRPERAQDMVARYGTGKATVAYREVLADPEVDAVSICTPNHLHAAIAIEAMRAGKDVLCEKPAARTLDEVLAMRRTRRETGRVLNIGVVNRFNGAVRKIRDLVAENALGQVYHVYVSFRARRSIPGLGGDFTNRSVAGGGVLIDWGVHFLDLVMFCCGDPLPVTVSGKAYCMLGRNIGEYVYNSMWAGPPDPAGVCDVEDCISGFIRTEGPTVSLNGAWAQNIGTDEMFVDFLGDRAGIRLQYGKGFTLYGARDGRLFDDSSIHYGNPPMFDEEIEDFVHSIRTRSKSVADLDTVLRSAAIIQALYDSSDRGQEVRFEEYDAL